MHTHGRERESESGQADEADARAVASILDRLDSRESEARSTITYVSHGDSIGHRGSLLKSA